MKISIDLKDFKKLMQLNQSAGQHMLDDAYIFFKEKTPIKSGNARRKTVKDNQRKTITGDYPYAQRLDEGWSKQAPEGMVQPTIDYINQRLSRYLKGK